MKTEKAGQRVGDWFLWIECEVAKTAGYRKIPVVTLRKAVKGGDIISTVVATPEMAKELRNAAAQIDAVLNGMQDESQDKATQ